jgi:hypothetical protein
MRQKLTELYKWTRKKIAAKGLIGILLLLWAGPPSFKSRTEFWMHMWPAIMGFFIEYQRVLLIVSGLVLIWLDHRRIVRKAHGKEIDPDSLKGRAIRLRDAIQKFLDSVGPKPTDRMEGESREQYLARSVSVTSMRVGKLLHGYEWRFSDDVRRLYHEFGEQGIMDIQLAETIARQLKNEEAYGFIISGLSRLAEKADTLDDSKKGLHA